MKRGDGWCFPSAVERLLKRETEGMTVLQLFGGKASWGIRLDIDPALRPDVVGDAWLPPFGFARFDVVIIDPPYQRFSTHEMDGLLRSAAMIARRSVWWLHTVWIPSRSYLLQRRSWLVRCGDLCQVRALQEFSPIHSVCEWPRYFTRGPAIKYNRWLAGQRPLPLLEAGCQ